MSLSPPSVGARRSLVLLAFASVFASLPAAFGALPPVPVPPENPITESKRVLGKVLFWDEQLSTSNVVSCGTCHTPGAGGADARIANHPGFDGVLGNADDVRGSAGIIRSDADDNFIRDLTFALRPQVTNRAANPMINAAYFTTLFWDGRATSQFIDLETGNIAIVSGGALESQAVNPPLSSIEMGHDQIDWASLNTKLARVRPLALATNHPSDVATALASKPDYPELFRRAFGDDRITSARIAFALATYQRTLISNQAPFDNFRAGVPNAMTPQQVQGFNAFVASNCAACHAVNNDLFTDNTFRNIGLRPNQEDLGRQIVTGNAADRGRFKVPSLRNVGLKRTFMHNGQFTTLPQVIGFYAAAAGVQPRPDNRDPAMNAVAVPPPAANVIQDFLVNGLTDPRVRNQTFPFDRPTLFTDRAADATTIIANTAAAGTGGIAPAIIAQSPSMIGNLEYRLGVETPGNLVGGSAYLAISATPPVAGRITPTEILGPFPITGTTTNGVATAHWPIRIGDRSDGDVRYAQWLIADAGAPNGEARSAAAQIRFFCGSMGCQTVCTADFDRNGTRNADDIFSFLDAWFSLSASADVNHSDQVTADDIFAFLDAWFAGCNS